MEKKKRVESASEKESARRGYCSFLRIPLGVFIVFLSFLYMMSLNLLQILSLVVYPFFPRAVHRFSCRLVELLWWTGVKYSTSVGGLKVIISGDKPMIREDGTPETAIVFANHQSYTDWLILILLAHRNHAMSYTKFFMKEILKYVPGLGLGGMLAGFIFLKRNMNKDAEGMAKAFNMYKKLDIPVWLISFLEGSRFNKHKMIANQEYAREHDLPVYNHVLLPRTKGFNATVQGLGSHLDAVYDCTIAYSGQRPSLWNLACGGGDYTVHLHIKRFPRQELPQEDQALRNWCIDRFSEKDTALEKFKKSDSLGLSVAEADVSLKKKKKKED